MRIKRRNKKKREKKDYTDYDTILKIRESIMIKKKKKIERGLKKEKSSFLQ